MFKKLDLFSKTEMKLLTTISTKDEEAYERELAKASDVSVGSVNNIMKKFVKMKLVTRTKKGRMLFYKRNDNNPFLRQYKILMSIARVMPAIQVVAPLSRKIILFGSCAEGLNGEKSDIDLFIISNEKEKIRRKLDKYSYLVLETVILNSSEYVNLKKKDKPLYERIVRGIELHAKEDEPRI